MCSSDLSRLAAAELAAARAEVEAAAAADAARAATAEVEVLRGSDSSSIAADDNADADLELLEREAARGRAAQWAAAHAHERGGSPDRRGRAGGAPGGGTHGGGAPGGGTHGGGAPGGGAHGGGVRVDGERGLHRQRGSLSPVRYRGHCYEYCVFIQEGPMGNIYREYKGGCHIQIRKYIKESPILTPPLKLMVDHTH